MAQNRNMAKMNCVDFHSAAHFTIGRLKLTIKCYLYAGFPILDVDQQ